MSFFKDCWEILVGGVSAIIGLVVLAFFFVIGVIVWLINGVIGGVLLTVAILTIIGALIVDGITSSNEK